MVTMVRIATTGLSSNGAAASQQAATAGSSHREEAVLSRSKAAVQHRHKPRQRHNMCSIIRSRDSPPKVPKYSLTGGGDWAVGTGLWHRWQLGW